MAYLKCGMLGFQGSGKTYTAAKLAIGLAREVGNKKPVAFYDTETGSDFVKPLFDEAGIELLVAKTRAFKDLLAFMEEAEKTCSVGIIDSISHVWIELLEATQRALHVNRLLFHHWGGIKSNWRQFTDLYVNSKLHVMLCGRAKWEYDYEEDEEGKKELIKTGTAMRAEAEMGYEPSLLLEMVRIRKSEITGDPNAKGLIHRCYVIKDRTDTMNGAEIDNPTYEHFRPVLAKLAIGGEHLGVDTRRRSDELIDNRERERMDRKRRIAVALEEIKNIFIENDLSGSSKEATKERLAILKKCFGTGSWSAIEGMKLEEMETGLAALKLVFSASLDGQEDDPEWDKTESEESQDPTEE